MFPFFILSDVLQGLLEPLQDKKSDFVLSEDFENAKFAESSDFLSWYAFPESGLWDISSSGRSGKSAHLSYEKAVKDTWLFSPAFQMKNGEIYEISFWLLVVGDKFNAGKSEWQ